ncbi:MAG TPA: tetratricopeptide repeat protein [Bacteroidota bacterium]|nr:tetratricopeptide repeat protein [Bacteroidota bacterium]
MRTQHIARVILLSTIVLVLSGCQVFSPVGDFISQRYTNTASYFNTYYNAQKAFSEAEREVLDGIKTGREKAAKGQKYTYVISPTARTKFTASIEKNSKLLTFYPTSKFVDDALLMIGKAYYYLEEDVKAERKFLELIAQYPESNVIPEAKLWYGKSLLRQNRTAEGLQQLGSLYTQALDQGEDDVAGGAALALGTYYFEQEDYQNALKYFRQSVEVLNDGAENARTQFQIGLCYSKLGDPKAAEEAFHAVHDFNPDYATTFQASLYESRMLTEQKKYEPALDLLFEKLDDMKYAEFFGTARREIGNTYAAEGKIHDAIAEYRYVDTAFARTDDAARSMFALASLYESKLFQYDSARVYYDKARNEFTASEITPAAILKSESFGKYFALKRDLGRMDTTIMEITIPGFKRRDTIAVMREDSIRIADSLAAVKGKQRTTLPIGGRDTIAAEGESNPDSAQLAASNNLLSRRTQSAAATDTAAGTNIRQTAGRTPQERDSVMRADSAAHISKIAADSTTRLMKARAERRQLDSLSRQITRSKFELAGILYLELNRPDSALVYFSDVVKSTTDSSLAARAYYTMADIYRTTDTTAHGAVDSLYRKIIDVAPASSYAQEARKYLHLPPRQETADSSEIGFLSGEQLMTEGKTAQAISTFRSIAETYPVSAYAPKALYTIGWLYENQLSNNDSAEAVYKRLTVGYPSSPYAAKVQPKLAAAETERREAEAREKAEKVKKEKEAKEKEAADKLKADTEKQKALGTPKAGAPADTTASDSLKSVVKPPMPPDTSSSRSGGLRTPVDSTLKPPTNPSPAIPDTGRSIHY